MNTILLIVAFILLGSALWGWLDARSKRRGRFMRFLLGVIVGILLTVGSVFVAVGNA
jgi:hypothetical protein